MKSPVIEVILPGSHFIVLPDALVAPFLEAGQKRVEVLAGSRERNLRFHAALLKRKGSYGIAFSKRYQRALGLFAGDYLSLQLLQDRTEFGVVVPEEFQEVLSQWPEAETAFQSLSDGAKRSLVYAIIRCRAPQSRIDKSLRACERLVSGIRNPRDLL